MHVIKFNCIVFQGTALLLFIDCIQDPLPFLVYVVEKEEKLINNGTAFLEICVNGSMEVGGTSA